MGINYIIQKDSGKDKNITISGRLFCEAIGNLVPDGSRNKRIPPYFLGMSKNILTRLFKGLMGGDGHMPEKKSWSYGTSSINLGYDFCDLCIKLGYNPRFEHGRECDFEIWIRRSKCGIINHKEEVPYSGIVWDLSVPNSNFLAYYDGTFFFTGNCPFPDLGDPQTNKRLYASKDGRRWYAHKTVSKIIQMSGRGVRSSTDYATTYILDEQFKRIYDDNKDMFPDWYKQALIF